MQGKGKSGKNAVILALLGIDFLLLERLMERDPEFAQRFDRAIGAPGREFISSLFSAIPFSMTELLLLLTPALLLLLLWIGIRASASRERTGRYVATILCSSLLFFCGYVVLLSPGYRRPPIEDALGLSAVAPSDAELSACADWLLGLAKEPERIPSEEEIVAALRASYQRLGERRALSVAPGVTVKKTVTPLFSRLGLFGLYAFPFGEITVAAECPMATRTFTLAHEMAHASGYSREEEADLVAFLACLESGDRYLSYVGATGMLSRMLTSLSERSPGVWESTSGALPDAARREISDANRVSEAEPAPAIADSTPDYDRTVLLLVAFFRSLPEGGTVTR